MRVNLTNILMGFLAGLIASLGGALKDSTYEGFHRLKFLRSVSVGTALGVVSPIITTEPILAFVFCGYFERIIVEGYKILRAQHGYVPGKFRLRDPSMLGAKFGFGVKVED